MPCDVVVLDLEDSVAPEAKDAARDAVCAAVKVYGAREVVRWIEETIADALMAAKKQGVTRVDLVMQGEVVQAVPAPKK